MRISSKINAALFGAFACGTLATYAVLESTIKPQFDEIERSAAQLNHKRVTDAFEAFTDKLKTATHDYAFWDETYSFMQGEKTDEYIASNLTPEFKAVENLGVNALIFLGADNEIRWGVAYDLETQEPLDNMVKEIAHFSRSHAYIGGSVDQAKRGIIRTSKGLLLVAIAPALKSDGTGDPRGKVISAKLLDVEAAKQLTGVDFSLEEFLQPVNYASLPENIELKTLDERIQTTSVLRSIIAQPLVYLKVNSPRDVSRAGSTAIRSAMLMMITVGLAAIGILWAFLERTVVSRVAALKKHFATAGSSGKITAAAGIKGNDEIGDLARSFNSMAGQVNHLRDALADSSYMSGLSEWAAGTLHNVRNGLAPVAATTWQVQQLFEGPWLKNIETAAKEHADAATTPDRREKLNTFLVGSAARFVEAAKKTTDLTAKINDSSQAILDIVAEFESYAHRKTTLERVDLLPMFKTVAASTINIQMKDAELVLPHASAMITGNEVILRQVISNIFVNAVEAIEGQQHPGRIEVSIATGGQNSALICIAISDNGEGLESDRLEAIFRRGVSTRNRASGGLGLHWCANAVKVMGGSIRAESDGPGLGATIILELPKYETNLKEAA